MNAKWRLIDTGSLDAAQNMAMDRVILDARADGSIPNTLRFMQFRTPAVLVGHHQAVAQEVRVDYCEDHGVEINRRLTGGGAIFFDPSQIGWEIVARLEDVGRPAMADLTKRICDAAAGGLQRLGINAQFRPRNDIEVDGKKISGTGGTVDDGVFLFQGTVLTDFDIEAMVQALRIPTEKLTEKGLRTLRDRVACLRDLMDPMPKTAEVKSALAEAFAAEFGVELVPEPVSELEQRRAAALLPEFQNDAWVHAVTGLAEHKRTFSSVHRGPGGLLRIHALVDVERSWLRQVLIMGDFFVNPRRAVLDLEAVLKDTPFAEVRARVLQFFDDNQVDLVGLTPDDFLQAIEMALEEVPHARPDTRDAHTSYSVPKGTTVA